MSLTLVRRVAVRVAPVALCCAAPAFFSQAATPRPEHPRPDFQREAWLNLNGEWQFAVDDTAEGERQGWASGREFPKRIVVPFCPESRLSGLGMATNYMPHVWYRKRKDAPRGQLRAGVFVV
jgi:hypothetical protein